MEIVQGRVREFLPCGGAEINGFVIEGGLEVRFPDQVVDLVMPMVAVGSRVEIVGHPYDASPANPRIQAALITSLDSGATAFLSRCEFPPKPEASLRHSHTPSDARPPAPPSPEPLKGLSLNSKPGQGTKGITGSKSESESAASEIEKAYEALHRTQALLAYVKILGRKGLNVGEIFDEAKLTYEQSLEHFYERKFSVALEYGAASKELSFAIESRVMRILRDDPGYPTLVSSPPTYPSGASGAEQSINRLNELSGLLSRLNWLLEHGTLPVEDREQVRRMVEWSEADYNEALRNSRNGAIKEALKLAESASAIGQSAGHICKQSYLLRECGA